MRRLTALAFIGCCLISVLTSAQKKKEEYPRLADKRYPILLKAIILDKMQRPIDVKIWLQNLKTGERQTLERIGEGVYKTFVENETEQEYMLLGNVNTIRFNSESIKVPAMTKRKQEVEKTLSLSLEKVEIQGVSQKSEDYQSKVLLKVKVPDTEDNPLDAQVVLMDEELDIKLENLNQINKGLFGTNFRQDFEKDYLLKVVYQDSTYQTLKVMIPAATEESQEVAKHVIIDLNRGAQEPIASASQKTIPGAMSMGEEKEKTLSNTLFKQEVLEDEVIEEVPEETSVEVPANNTVAEQASSASALPKPLDEDLLTESTLALPEDNKRVVLWDLKFTNHTTQLLPESKEILDQLYLLIRQHPETQFEIGAHTDNSYPAGKSKAITQAQAEKVVDYLIDKGIEANRIKAVGYGAAKPIASNDDEKDGRELNRRVDYTTM
ncbi:MAG: OmpA family protein [Thermonemataceae bacterium]